MIPEMPPLIPTNTFLIPTYPVPEYDQNIEDQKQLVKKFQQIIFQEEMIRKMAMDLKETKFKEQK